VCVADRSVLWVGGPGGTPRAVLAGRLEWAAVLRGARYDPGSSFEIAPQLVDGQGEPIEIGPVSLKSSVSAADGFRRLVLSFTPETVAPGEYSFRVRFRDPASARVSESFQSLRVEPPSEP
jgi:hypothetical protein